MKNWFTIKKLDEGVWGLGEFGHFEKVISYLIVGKRRAVLFDTGLGVSNISKEVRKITKLPLIIVNSHCHFDHVGGNNEFTNLFVMDSYLSKKIAREGYSHNEIIKNFSGNNFSLKPPESFDPLKFCIPPFQLKKFLKDNSMINFSPFHFKVVHTPGHSPDSICLYEEKKGLLFSGDTLYPGPIYLFLPESNIASYKKSIKKLKDLPYVVTIFPAHNEFSFEKRNVTKIYSILQKNSGSTVKKNIIKIDSKTSLVLKD